jgi:signal transduction histidine kinase/CheY-like chemotaxis protein
MTSLATTVPLTSRSQKEWLLAQLREQAIRLALPMLVFGGLLLLGFPSQSQPVRSEWSGILLWLLALAIWGLGRLSRLAAAWALVIGFLLADLLVVAWGGVAPAVVLLTLPVGFAVLAVSMAAGAATAVGCTLLVLWGLPTLPAAGPAWRAVAVVGIWSTIGLLWLTTRPFLTALEWSWSSYEQSQRLLDQARDYQVQLKQTLRDLADANVQLTRLNNLAQALRQAAEDARRAKEQFVANVSHELRTPLNMIVGFSEMMLQAPRAYGSRIPPALLADLAIIHRNSQHLSSLIDDVLDLSQIEAGRMALTKERVALAEIVEAAVIAVRPLFESKSLYLEAETEADLPLVYCDRTRVREVLLNLLSNAGRFTERGGVRVRTWREGDGVVVSVADSGPGIADEQKDRLFRPFEQLDGSSRRRHGGSGLGLSISRAFVELHGGQMWLESQLGSGTVFSFRLPIDPPVLLEGSVARWLRPGWEYEERPQRSLAPPAVVRPRFVVLERGDSLARLLSRYVDGAEAVPVSTLEEATQELARVPARALVINDESVSEGLQMTQSAALPYGTPAIVCAIPGVYEAAGSLGIADYLVKPISRDQMLAALDRLDLRGGTVLLVDDEPEALRLFQRMLGSAEQRYRVLEAGDGRQALQILREQRPDVILLDLVMPEMDGFAFLEARSQDPALLEIPVIVISARDPAGQPVVGQGLGLARGGGLSMPQVLACIEALSGILGTAGQAGDPGPRETPRG